MRFDFLSHPVDFQTTYFLVFGGVAVYGIIMLFLIRIQERRQRGARRDQK
jgi:hypothetical protein